MSREQDEKLIKNISIDEIADFVFMNLRNMWAVDGLYFLGIEEKYGTEIATEIDAFVWKTMGKIEARKIKNFFNIKGDDVSSMIEGLKYSGWALDLEDKEIIIEKDKAIIRNTKCRVQNTRIKNEQGEFGCKAVRFGFLKSFAKEFSSDITVTCNVCPPDDHPDDLWCEWVFEKNKE